MNNLGRQLGSDRSTCNPRRRSMSIGTMAARAFAALIVVLSGAACSESEPPAERGDGRRERCIQLRDRTVDFRLESVEVDREQHRAALRNALGERYVKQCEETHSDAQLECALRAPDKQAVEQCLAAPISK